MKLNDPDIFTFGTESVLWTSRVPSSRSQKEMSRGIFSLLDSRMGELKGRSRCVSIKSKGENYVYKVSHGSSNGCSHQVTLSFLFTGVEKKRSNFLIGRLVTSQDLLPYSTTEECDMDLSVYYIRISSRPDPLLRFRRDEGTTNPPLLDNI